MKNILVKCIVAAVIALMLIGIAAKLILEASPDRYDETTISSESSNNLYTLTDYNGKIALFKQGYSMPVEIFDVNISSLPQSDRELIENGISASTDEEAQRLIEDYTS